jgi:hypothetical protein
MCAGASGELSWFGGVAGIWVREMPGAATYRATLKKKGRVAHKPAVQLLYTVV